MKIKLCKLTVNTLEHLKKIHHSIDTKKEQIKFPWIFKLKSISFILKPRTGSKCNYNLGINLRHFKTLQEDYNSRTILNEQIMYNES